MAEVQYEQATRIYPGTESPAVDDLDLTVRDGEMLVLVGPSGSGKSTALRMLAGLEPIDGGRVWIGGRDVTLVAPRDRDIAMVFQNYALYPSMTVAQNMGFALKQQGVDSDERRSRVEEAARILDLADYLDRKPKNLSGGQRQRVAMGRAIVREPQVFLMDEPLSNLDAKLRVNTRMELADLQARLGVTTVYVTHDQVEAMTMGDRVAVLEGGVLQQCDTPRRLYDNPVNEFVAGFIGSPAMNFMTVPVGEDGTIAMGELQLPVDDDVKQALVNGEGGSEVTAGIRPEHLRVGDEGLPGEVLVVEELGSESYYHIEVEGNRDRPLVVRTEGHAAAARGDRVRVRADGPVHVFADDGARIGEGA